MPENLNKEQQAQLVQRERLSGIGRLMAGIAHELNNPLSYVTGNIGILQACLKNNDEALTPGELQDIMSDIDEGLHRMNELVTALRKISHADKGDFSEYDLNDGIRTALAAAHFEIKYSASVQLQLGSIPNICANEALLNQALLNLILAAVHSINSKDTKFFGAITVRTSGDSNSIRCEIEDNGAGISEDETGRMAEPLNTADFLCSGTGLGWRITYDIIVNRHFGELLVQSAPGGGSTILIKLPVG